MMTDKDDVLHSDRSRLVTRSFLKTRHRVYALDDVDMIELRRPLLVFAAAAWVLLNALALRFSDILFASELAWITGSTTLLVVAGSQVSVLRVHSLSLQGERVIGWHWRLRQVQAALETALRSRTPRARRRRIDGLE